MSAPDPTREWVYVGDLFPPPDEEVLYQDSHGNLGVGRPTAPNVKWMSIPETLLGRPTYVPPEPLPEPWKRPSESNIPFDDNGYLLYSVRYIDVDGLEHTRQAGSAGGRSFVKRVVAYHLLPDVPEQLRCGHEHS